MTDLTEISTYKYFLMAAVHQDLRASNHDDNQLPTDEICTIMCSEPSNVTNPADGHIPKLCSHFSREGRTMYM